jgi:hypothetical protein
MLELLIADLITKENQFEVPSSLGKWTFTKSAKYDSMAKEIEIGKCGNTFVANHNIVLSSMSDINFKNLCSEIIDICLILSFITTKCVTVKSSAPYSDIQFLQLGDCFLRSRAITGFQALKLKSSFQNIFTSGICSFQQFFEERRLRLFLSHWLSGLTCFTLEDLFLATCVEMDIVKQCEMQAEGGNLTYFEGMEKASERYQILKLSEDFKNMRNDLIHYGCLSCQNNKGKTKAQCSKIAADALNWIDLYVINALKISDWVCSEKRWRPLEIEHGLPSISLT